MVSDKKDMFGRLFARLYQSEYLSFQNDFWRYLFEHKTNNASHRFLL